MSSTVSSLTSARPARYTETDCQVMDFAVLVDQVTDCSDYPHAVDVQLNVLIYDASRLRDTITSDEGCRSVEAELARALTDGPGVVAFKGAFGDTGVVDQATAAFNRIITEEQSAGGGHNDHFAKAGANSRVWNALEKLAVRDPVAFVAYYGNEILALVSNAWLGPGYQVTSQVNVVRPGGKAQDPHRDYHLGFLSNEVATRYPAQVHLLSPALTLQGAVAHSDMPVESGPTMYLPYSHQYAPGYLAWRLPKFRDFFAQRYVQLPLAKGDAVFFNPALFHGAGTNVSTDVQRMANLLQVSSAFGRAMETVDRGKVVKAIYPALQAAQASGVAPAELDNAVAAAAEGYPFPSNLDLDENVDGLTPLAQAALVRQAVTEVWSPEQLADSLEAYDVRHRTDDI